MSCRDIKTPHSPNMGDIPKGHLSKDKSGSIVPDPNSDSISWSGGLNTSRSSVSTPRYGGGIQTNSDNVPLDSNSVLNLVLNSNQTVNLILAVISTSGLSSKTDYARVKLTTNQNVSTSTRTVVLFNTTDSDTNGWYTIFGHKMVPNKAGIYFVSHYLEILFDSISGDWDSSIYKNGVEFSHYNHARFASGGGSSLVPMNGTTDELTIRFRIFAILPNAISASTSGKRSFFEIYRIGDIP